MGGAPEPGSGRRHGDEPDRHAGWVVPRSGHVGLVGGQRGKDGWMKIGWFGIGSGRLSDRGAVRAIGQAAEDLGFESLWVGEHPVLIDPREAPSPLPPHTPLLDPVAVLSYLACS